MKAGLTLVCGALIGAALAAVPRPNAAPDLVHPRIDTYGGIVLLPDAAEPPRKGSKVVFDVTAGGKDGEVNPGLDRVARFVNLCAGAGVETGQVRLAAVLHGPATRAVLTDEAYNQHAGGERNPNQELLARLSEAGVELLVCGQALAHHGYEQDEVGDGAKVAVAAMTVVVNRQQDGWAYVLLR